MSGHAQLIPIAKLVGPRKWNCHVRIGYATIAHRNDAGFSIRLHSTQVVHYDHMLGELVIATGGWQSGITAQRINHGLAHLGLHLLTRDLPNRWRVADDHGNAWTIRGNRLVLLRQRDSWQRC